MAAIHRADKMLRDTALLVRLLRAHRLDDSRITGDTCSCGDWDPAMTASDHTRHVAEVLWASLMEER